MYLRRAVALAVSFVVLLAAQRASAWQEAHETGDDARIVVEPNGVASVRHLLRLHVVRGPVKFVDLANVEPAAVIEASVPVTADDGRAMGAQAVSRDDGSVRITLDDPRGLPRGTFSFELRYRADLVASGALARDGATWRLTVSAPIALDGFDGARTVIDLPVAPDEPRPIEPDTGAVDESVVATLRRGIDRDVLELVRPHVARGESALWTVRVDSRALKLVANQDVRPPSDAGRSDEPDRIREASFGMALAALALAFGLLVAHKGRIVAKACAERAGRPRALLPLRDGVRAVVAGIAFAAAVGLEGAGETIAAASCVALAIVAASFRAPRAKPAPRGPGTWVTLRPEEAFVKDASEGHWLDLGSPRGRLTACIGLVLVTAAAIVARRLDAQGAWFVALDSAAFVPLFLTGRATQLPPHGVHSAKAWLGRAFNLLRRVAAVRVAPWARVAPDGGAADELRLLVMPRVAMPGVVGLEIGLAWSTTPVSWAASPEVLARVLEGSPAALKLGRDVPRLRAMPGRRPEERVIRLLPRAPTRSGTIALVRHLAEALTDRRAPGSAGAWTAGERRAPDVSREAAQAGSRGCSRAVL